MVVISLIGEQPIPTLLPLYHLKPTTAVLVHTSQTKRVAEQLAALLQKSMRLHQILTKPYDIQKIRSDLKEFFQRETVDVSDLIFNLTGGTKMMTLAAYEVAREYQAPFLYLQSEGRQSRLYRYRFEDGETCYEGHEDLPKLITIDDYLRAHVGSYDATGPSTGAGGRFETAVAQALKGAVDEVLTGVRLGEAREPEVDLVVRCGNQVGVISAKMGETAKKKVGLDQLNAACARENLGTYTAKMLVINQTWPAKYNLRDLARAWGITVIELPSFSRASPYLSPEDSERLIQTVRQVLGADK